VFENICQTIVNAMALTIVESQSTDQRLARCSFAGNGAFSFDSPASLKVVVRLVTLRVRNLHFLRTWLPAAFNCLAAQIGGHFGPTMKKATCAGRKWLNPIKQECWRSGRDSNPRPSA
jgi:hypothetical protein